MNSLVIHYNEKAYENMSFIDTGTQMVDEVKSYDFALENISKFDIVELSLETNLPDDSFIVSIPTSIKPNSREAMTLTITNPEKIMNEVDEKIYLSLKYFVEKQL